MANLHIELRRLLSPYRVGLFTLLVLPVAYVLADNLRTRATNGRFAINGWDVPMELLNNLSVFAIVFLPVLTAVVGDAAIRDRQTGYAALTVSRTPGRWGGRERWWRAKVMAVVLGAAAYVVIGVLLAAIVGLATTGSVPLWLSEYGSATSNPLGLPVQALKGYGPPPLAPHAIAGLAVITSYAALAAGAFVAAVMGIASFVGRPWVPLPLTLGISLLCFGLEGNAFNPLVHLFYDTHTFGGTRMAIEWWASFGYIACELLLALAVGRMLARRADLLTSRD